MTNTYMLGGDADPADIVAELKDGIYAVGFGGGQVDITNGKFVFSCTEAYRVKNGKVGAPVKGATLIGDGADGAAADPRHRQRHGARPRHRQLRQGRAMGAGGRGPADAADRRADGRRLGRLSRRTVRTRRRRPVRRGRADGPAPSAATLFRAGRSADDPAGLADPFNAVDRSRSLTDSRQTCPARRRGQDGSGLHPLPTPPHPTHHGGRQLSTGFASCAPAASGPTTFYRLMAEHGTRRRRARGAARDRARRRRRRLRALPAKASPRPSCAPAARAGRPAARLRACRPTPPPLADLPDAPPLLWALGDAAPARRGRWSALVGARNASSPRHRAWRARLAARAGRGRASSSSRASPAGSTPRRTPPRCHGGTVAVHGRRRRRDLPGRERRSRRTRSRETGLRLSEQPMGLQPQARHFPRRNRHHLRPRPRRGGGRGRGEVRQPDHRARRARPGARGAGGARATRSTPAPRGCNMLIRDGATLVRGAERRDRGAGRRTPPRAAPRRRGPAGARRRRARRPPAARRRAAARPASGRACTAAILDRLGPSPAGRGPADPRPRPAAPARSRPSSSTLELDGRIVRQPGGLLSRPIGRPRTSPEPRPPRAAGSRTASGDPLAPADRAERPGRTGPAPRRGIDKPRPTRPHVAPATSATRPLRKGHCMPVVVVESPAKAKTINKYLGADYTVLASYGHVRDLPPKDGSVDPEHDFEMKWEVGARQPQARQGDRRRAEGRQRADPRHRPRPRGRGDLAGTWRRRCASASAIKKDTPVSRVVFNAITKTAVTEAMKNPAPGRCAAGRGLSRPPRARLPRRLQPLAGALAQAARREVGRPGAVGLPAPHRRARDGDRGVPRPANTGPSRRCSPRRAARNTRRG